MQAVPLGETGIAVSQVILGCGSIGGIGTPAASRGRGLSPKEGWTQLDEAAAHGVTTLDTANSYAGGVSEQVVGKWLRAHPDEPIVVSTKVGNLVDPAQTEIDLSAGHIAEQVQLSLDRLGRIDLYLAHAPDPRTPIEETLEAFAAILASGKAQAIGGCHLDAPTLELILTTADRLGLPAYSWIQNEYNLLERDDKDLLDLVRDQNLGYTPFSPLAGGVLAGRYRRGEPPPPGSRMSVLPDYIRDLDTAWDALDRLADQAAARNVSMAALALAWVLAAPHVTAPIVAPRPSQFADVDAALALNLAPDEWDELGTLVTVQGQV